MSKKESVIVFGLDGATFKILDPLIEEGKVPTIAQLTKQGIKAELKSVIPPLTGAAWVTFQTGVLPGRHGIFDFLKPDGSLITASDIKLPKIWQIIAKMDLKSCVINMPVTYPVHPMNGILISSLLTPPNQHFAYPASVERELRKNNYLIDLEDPFGLEKGVYKKKEVIGKLESLVHSRGEAALMLVEKEPWDFFFVLFRATDLIQHLDYAGPATARIYKLIDQYIGKIIKTFKKKHSRKLHILILSDHGFHKQAKRDIAFYPLLRSLGMLKPSHSIILRLRRLIRKILKGKSKMDKITSYGMFEADRKKRRLIVNRLRGTKIDSQKVFQIVTTAEKLYGSNYHPNIPDILWLTDPNFAPNADSLSDRLIYPKHSPLKGHHYSDRYGIFIANSSNIKPSASPKIVELHKVTTLICELLNVPYPEYFTDQLFTII